MNQWFVFLINIKKHLSYKKIQNVTGSEELTKIKIRLREEPKCKTPNYHKNKNVNKIHS